MLAQETVLARLERFGTPLGPLGGVLARLEKIIENSNQKRREKRRLEAG